MTPVHPSGIAPSIVAKVVARRGRLHAFETMDAATTALVIVDMNTASVEADPTCRGIVGPIDTLASMVRRTGGIVAWVLPAPSSGPSADMAAVYGPERAAHFAAVSALDHPGAALWSACAPAREDIMVRKTGASAFFPGKCDLGPMLSARGVQHILIAGTVTNVCCESSARDAVELGYRVTLVSDALAGHAHGLHEATLATFYRSFGDVRPSREIIGLLGVR